MQRRRGWSGQFQVIVKLNSHSYRSDQPVRDAHWERESFRSGNVTNMNSLDPLQDGAPQI